MEQTEKEIKETFKEVVEPVIKWLNDNCHPHHTIVIDSTRAELLEGEIVHRTEKFIRDWPLTSVEGIKGIEKGDK